MISVQSTGDKPSNAHQIVSDLHAHSAQHYWADLLISASIFWGVVLLGSRNLHWLPVVLTVGTLALYRLALFSHEISHFRRGVLPGFEAAWNVICGMPILLPSFMLKSHVDHHASRSYGTSSDPEYLPFSSYPQLRKRFLFGAVLVPVTLVIRSLVMVPLAWLIPKRRAHLHQCITFMSMNSVYRPGPAQNPTLVDQIVDMSVSVWVWTLLVASITGLVPWRFAELLLTCATLASLLNGWRTLQAHHYASRGQPMDARAQLLDSTTFSTYWLWGELLCPVGQRFHAAHHLLPYLPYHALPEAHRRLMSMDWAGRTDYVTTFSKPLGLKASLGTS